MNPPQRQCMRLDGAAKPGTIHRMKILTAAIIATAILIAMPMPSWAGGNPAERPDADAMIKACWDATLAQRSSPRTGHIYDGILDSVLCLEDRIVDQFKVFSPNLTLYLAPEDKRPTVEKVREKVREIRTSAGALYWWIYNEHPGCKPNCGTMYYTFHLTETAAIYEHMLKAIVAQRIEYEF